MSKKEVVSVVFRSPEEALRYCEEAFLNPPASWAGKWNGRRPGEFKFFGTESFEDAAELFRKGWKEGAARVAALSGKCSKSLEAIRSKVNQVQYDVAGCWLDVARAVAGEPECWGSVVPVEVSSVNDQVVRVDCNVACSGGITREAFFRRGAAVLVFVDLVEALGKRVELWAVTGEQSYKGHYQCRVLVKAAGEQADPGRLAFMLAHPSWFRRVQFCVGCAHGFPPDTTIPADYTYDGIPCEQREEFGGDPNVVVFPKMHLTEVANAGGAQAFIEQKLSEAGLEVEGLFDENEPIEF